jgi:hypothetical protein
MQLASVLVALALMHASADATRNRLIGAANWYGEHRAEAAIRPDSDW